MADTPRGLQPFQPGPFAVKERKIYVDSEGKETRYEDRAASAAARPKSELTHEGARNVYEPNGKDVTPAESKDANGDSNGAGLEDKLKEQPVRVYCSICGNDCTAIRHHNAKPAPSAAGKPTFTDICPECFKGSEFYGNYNKSDFTVLQQNPFPHIADASSTWSESEELLLLEGLEMFDDDWNKISDHVASRTREECVLKFLQMEIEDGYLDGEPNTVGGVRDGVKDLAGLTVLNGGRVPFSQADNPVLATMSYLVGLADPATTAAASGKAVAEVRKTMRARLEKTAAASESDKGKEKAGTVKAEGAMDVDTASSPQANDDNAVAITSANATTTLPFALSAARAAGLASHEERTLTKLIHTATNLQMEKLELKMKQFSELEAMLSAERRDLERRRQQLFLDRLQFQRRVRNVEDTFKRACSLQDPREGMKVVREALGAGAEGLVVKKVDAGEGGEVQPLEGKGFEI
jgi:SWI/SNF related-matrix-associated actin-dependent regulator of chromatin subfamily C